MSSVALRSSVNESGPLLSPSDAAAAKGSKYAPENSLNPKAQRTANVIRVVAIVMIAAIAVIAFAPGAPLAALIVAGAVVVSGIPILAIAASLLDGYKVAEKVDRDASAAVGFIAENKEELSKGNARLELDLKSMLKDPKVLLKVMDKFPEVLLEIQKKGNDDIIELALKAVHHTELPQVILKVIEKSPEIMIDVLGKDYVSPKIKEAFRGLLSGGVISRSMSRNPKCVQVLEGYCEKLLKRETSQAVFNELEKVSNHLDKDSDKGKEILGGINKMWESDSVCREKTEFSVGWDHFTVGPVQYFHE